jgi:hypothetical protein
MPVGDLLQVNQTKSVPNRLMNVPLRLSPAFGILSFRFVVLIRRNVVQSVPPYWTFTEIPTNLISNVKFVSYSAYQLYWGGCPWSMANYRDGVVWVTVAVFIERSKHGAYRRLGLWCSVLDDTRWTS